MAEAAGAPERKVYEAGTGRKTILSLAFLILLPFWASLPAMLIQRLLHLRELGLQVLHLGLQLDNFAVHCPCRRGADQASG